MATTNQNKTAGAMPDAAAPVVDLVKQGQENMLKAVQVWSESVQKIVPDSMSLTPNADSLPTPKEVLDSAYDFAEQLLAVQRSFAQGVFEAIAPVFGLPLQAAKAAQDAVKS